MLLSLLLMVQQIADWLYDGKAAAGWLVLLALSELRRIYKDRERLPDNATHSAKLQTFLHILACTQDISSAACRLFLEVFVAIINNLTVINCVSVPQFII